MARKGPLLLLLCLSLFVATGALPTGALERHGDSIAQPERPAHAGSGEGYPGTVAPETPNNLQSGAPPISNRDPPTTSVGAHSPVPIAEGPTGTLPRPGDHLLNGRPFERPFPGGFLSRDPFSRGPFPDRLFPAGPPPGGLRRGPYQAEPYPERLLLERPHPGEPPTGGLAPGGPLSEEPFPGGDFPEGQHPEGPFPGELSPQGPHPAEPLVGEPFSRGPLPGGPFPGGPFLGGPLPGGPFPMGPFPMRIRTFPRRLFPGGPSHAGLPHEGSFPDGPFPGLPSQDDAARPHIARSQGEPTQEKTPVPPSRPRGEPLFPAQGGATITNVIHNKNTVPSYSPFQQTWTSFIPTQFPFRGRFNFPFRYGRPFSTAVFPHFTNNFCNCAMGSRCMVMCYFSPHYKFSY